MKKLALITLFLICTCAGARAFDLRSILGAMAGQGQEGANTEQTTKGTADILTGLGDILTSLTQTSEFDLSTLVGTWKYSSPAVTFQGNSAIEKIGGVAAAATIENKLKGYYKTAGIDKMELTVNDDLSFTIKLKKGKLSGKISRTTDDNGNEVNDGRLIFNFSAAGAIPVGKVAAYATRSGKQLVLTFDVTKLISICQKVAAISGSSTFQTLSSLLGSYEGLYVGCKLKKK